MSGNHARPKSNLPFFKDMQARKDNTKVQPSKNLEKALKTLREENDKSKGIINTLEVQLTKNTNIQADVQKNESENENLKGVIKALEAQLEKNKIESANTHTELEAMQQQNQKVKSDNENCKSVIEALEVQLERFKIESANLQTQELLQGDLEVVQTEVENENLSVHVTRLI